MGKGRGGFPGGAMPGNMQNLMKQAQKMQADLMKKQEQLESREVKVTSGGGAVEVTITGDKMIKAININPEVVDKDDVETLQDLILAAVNEAMRKLIDEEKDTYGNLTGGFNLPF